MVDFPSFQSNNDTVDIYEEIVEPAQGRPARRGGDHRQCARIDPSFETAKMLVRDDGSIVGTIGGGCVEAEVWQAAREVMESEKPRTLTFNLNQNPKYDTGLVCGGTLDIFIEPVLPPALLYIFGAGHVARKPLQGCEQCGLRCYRGRRSRSLCEPRTFSEAQDVIAEDFDLAMARLAPTESSYIVIVTRGHRDDMRVLRWAVQTQARYIGMIGSKRKTITIFRELVKEGLAAASFRSRTCPRWLGYWRDHAGRNRRGHHRRTDRRAPPTWSERCRT